MQSLNNEQENLQFNLLQTLHLCIDSETAGSWYDAKCSSQYSRARRTLFYIHEGHEMVNILPTLQTPSQRGEG